MASPLEALHARAPQVGADIVALALRTLNVILECARLDRLTRHQHILFRLGEWIAQAETAASLAQYAAQDGTRDSKEVSGFESPVVQAMSRIYAREVALHIASEGSRWLVGTELPRAQGPSLRTLETELNLEEIFRSQQGLMADSDLVAQALREA